jgi:sterol desaturase/sphingolipid hydroxylase (fatty acid hydroxylase superfamily)
MSEWTASEARTKLMVCRDWLLAPIGRASEMKRRLLFRAVRSRFFFLVALLTALPLLVQALAATWKAVHPKPEVGPVLLWATAVAAWILFLLTLLSEHWRLSRKSERNQRVRFWRRRKIG